MKRERVNLIFLPKQRNITSEQKVKLEYETKISCGLFNFSWRSSSSEGKRGEDENDNTDNNKHEHLFNNSSPSKARQMA